MIKTCYENVKEELHLFRLDVAAHFLFPELSRKKIKKIIDNGGAYVNKKRITMAKHIVKQNDKIQLYWEEEKTQDAKMLLEKDSGFSIDSLVVFENQHFIVVNKPHGIPSQSTLTSSNNCIITLLSKLCPDKFSNNSLFLIHRLDKDTSGLMLLAKNKQSQQHFEQLFRERKMLKEYHALCFFKPKHGEGTINFPIARYHNRENAYYALTHNEKNPQAKTACTEYKVEETFSRNQASHIVCFPKTGRTHQIRVHLSGIGCPIIGDKTYSQNVIGHEFQGIAVRQMLHASKISFTCDYGEFTFHAPYPSDFSHALSKLREKL